MAKKYSGGSTGGCSKKELSQGHKKLETAKVLNESPKGPRKKPTSAKY